MNLSHQWAGWAVLVCVGLMPAVDAACVAAEAAPAQPRAAPAVKRAEPARPKPAGGVENEEEERVEPARPQPAAKGRSLIQAMADALGGGVEDRRRNIRVVTPQVVNDANIRNLEAQFRPQFQQLLYVELAFLRRVCKVDAKTFVGIAKAAKAGLPATAHEYAVSQNARMRGRVMIRGRIEDAPETIDPRSQVQRLLEPIVQSKLGPEQAKRYRRECDQRAAGRRRAVVLNLVAVLDERLVLSAEQRAKLVQSLSSSYQSAWDQYAQMQMFTFNVQYLPSIRDESIVPLLNERQKAVWQEIPKYPQNVFFGFNFARGGVWGQSAEIQEIARIVEETPDEQ